MANKTRWEITGEIKPIGWLDYPITNYEILDNGFLKITHYWQDPDNNDVYKNGSIEIIEIPPCDLHSDGTWEEIDSIEEVEGFLKAFFTFHNLSIKELTNKKYRPFFLQKESDIANMV